MFIMDYSSSLEDCKPMVGLKIYSGEAIILMNIQRVEVWGLAPILQDAGNENYSELYQEFSLIENEDPVLITIRVSRKV